MHRQLLSVKNLLPNTTYLLLILDFSPGRSLVGRSDWAEIAHVATISARSCSEKVYVHLRTSQRLGAPSSGVNLGGISWYVNQIFGGGTDEVPVKA